MFKVYKVNSCQYLPYMRKTVSDIIKETFYILNDKWNIFMCASTLQLLSSLIFLLFLPPFGYIIALLFYAITSVTLARHNLKRFDKQDTKFENIFDFKNFFAVLTTKIIRCIQICFWSIFMIIPGVLVAIDYSMVDFILAENPNLDSFEALNESIKLARKHRGKIFVMFLLYCLLLSIVIIFACSLILITKFFTPVSSDVAFISLLVITGILYLFVVLPFIKVSSIILYKDLKDSKEKLETKEKFTKKTSTKTA